MTRWIFFLPALRSIPFGPMSFRVSIRSRLSIRSSLTVSPPCLMSRLASPRDAVSPTSVKSSAGAIPASSRARERVAVGSDSMSFSPYEAERRGRGRLRFAGGIIAMSQFRSF